MNRLKYIAQITEITSGFRSENEYVPIVTSIIDEIMEYYDKRGLSSPKEKIILKEISYHNLLSINEEVFLSGLVKICIISVRLSQITNTQSWKKFVGFYNGCI